MLRFLPLLRRGSLPLFALAAALLLPRCGKDVVVSDGDSREAEGGRGGEGGVPETFGPVVHDGPLRYGDAWSRAWGETADEGYCLGGVVAVDPRNGDVYAATSLYGPSDADSTGQGRQPVDLRVGQTAILLTKFSPEGEQLRTWLWTSEGETDHQGWGNDPRGILIEKDGSVLLTGNYSGRIDFDPGPGVAEATSTVPGFDGFVLRLDAKGDIVGVKTLGSIKGRFTDIVRFGDALFVTGQYLGELPSEWGLRPTVAEDLGEHGVHGPYVDCFLARLDADLSTVDWTVSWGAEYSTEYNCGVTSNESELFVVGDSDSHRARLLSADLETSIEGDPAVLTQVGVAGSFTPEGETRWFRSWYGDAHIYPDAVLAFANALYSSGQAFNVGAGSQRYGSKVVNYGDDSSPLLVPLLGEWGTKNAFVARLDEGGRALWAKHWGGGATARVLTMVHTETHLVAVGLGSAGTSFGALGTVDADLSAFVVTLSPAGDELAVWMPRSEPGGYTVGESAAISGDSLYVLGGFAGAVDFSDDPAIEDRWSGPSKTGCFLVKRPVR